MKSLTHLIVFQNANGGKIIFTFSPKADYVFSLGILDVDYPVKIFVTYMNDAGATLTKTIPLPILGDNSYQVRSQNRVSSLQICILI